MAGKEVRIAIVGTGFIAETRARAYAGVTGYEARLVAAVSRTRDRLDSYARRNERTVIAEVGDLTRTPGFQEESRHFVVTGWVDVENWGTAIVTFDDGTRATVFASDAVLGGMESTLQVLMSNAHIKCNLSRKDTVR